MRAILFLLALALPLPAAAQVRLLETGIYCVSPRTGETIEAPGTIEGRVWTIDGRPFDTGGRLVPLQPGLGFGIRTALKSDTDLPVRMVTRHPPLPGAGGRTEGGYDTVLRANSTHIRSFTFDYDYEMVPGQWVFEVWDGDRLLLSVEFEVVARRVPAVDRVCGAMMQT